MNSNPGGAATELLIRWNSGDQSCLDELVSVLEPELRRIAHRQMRRERDGHTLQTTALINEAYLRLVDQARVNWQGRAHFLGAASAIMRRILVDHARGLSRQKRGASAGRPLPIDEALVFTPEKAQELVALDDALAELARADPRRVRVVEMRYFGGLSVEETAEALGVHPNTVIRDWALTKAWLKRQLAQGAPHGI